MFHLTGLILLTVFLYILLKNLLDKGFLRLKTSYESLRNERVKLTAENQKIKQDDASLKKSLEETVALYDITKQICRSLDEDKVFAYFKEEITKHIECKDCSFVKQETDLAAYKDAVVLPLEINKVPVAYLAAKGVQTDEREKFYILAQQCLLGLKRAILYQQVQELAITDSLTGVFTRRHYLERLREELDYTRKFSYPLSVLMLDIDHFKSFNDHYGHLVGDAILRFISKLIKDNLRQVDLLCRYGGEEFSIILTNTDKEGAKLAAERIRQSVEDGLIKVYDENLKVTISIGVATFPEDGRQDQMLIEMADKALYKAKQNGRNQVVCS